MYRHTTRIEMIDTHCIDNCIIKNQLYHELHNVVAKYEQVSHIIAVKNADYG